jgi:hypothetical protein
MTLTYPLWLEPALMLLIVGSYLLGLLTGMYAFYRK